MIRYKCYIFVLVCLSFILFFHKNACADNFDSTFFDKTCGEFVTLVDGNTLNDEDAAFVVGYISGNADIQEEDFLLILNAVYVVCQKNQQETLGDTLEFIIQKSK